MRFRAADLRVTEFGAETAVSHVSNA